MMLCNPFMEQHRVRPMMGTRLLENFRPELVGARIRDPTNFQRLWTLQAFYAPVPGRALGGVRARLLDQKGFATFINQRDLEILLGIAEPGSYCRWTGRTYPAPGEPDWYGFTMDEEDLQDDLHTVELLLRAESPTNILYSEEIIRRLHIDESDYEEIDMLLWDLDPETGMSPDPRLETVTHRWRRIERTTVRWEYVT